MSTFTSSTAAEELEAMGCACRCDALGVEDAKREVAEKYCNGGKVPLPLPLACTVAARLISSAFAMDVEAPEPVTGEGYVGGSDGECVALDDISAFRLAWMAAARVTSSAAAAT
jgi:hypothetical protein